MPTTSKHANDDVIIASAEGKIYKISQAQLQQFPMLVDKTDPECKHILDLLDAGVTAAYMPPRRVPTRPAMRCAISSILLD